MHVFLTVLIILTYFTSPALASEEKICAVEDKGCLLQQLEQTASDIENPSWRDKSYRELAKSYTYEGYIDEAVALIEKVENPDTRAMTIRGIGMAAASGNLPKEEYDALFSRLTEQSDLIDHPPSKAIAYTYIAMSQAFAGDDKGATQTARAMENDALKNKAFAETAEIQAERGDFKAAMASIGEIQSLAFKNKAHRIVAEIFIKKGMLKEAYDAALKIQDNAYARAEVLQDIVNADNPEE